jgi:hypothetical protein
VGKWGNRNVVYFDETGFQQEAVRPHGWSLRGVKVHGKISGNNHKKTNLIMAQRGKKWLAPMLFEKSCTHKTVNAWIEHVLLKELPEPSLIIMDNAPFHNKPQIRKILETNGHALLPLPKYIVITNHKSPCLQTSFNVTYVLSIHCAPLHLFSAMGIYDL